MPDKLITIANYLEPVEAEMLRNRLEEQGIRAAVADVGVVAMAWYLSQAVGGIKLLVFEKDVEQAREIMADMQAELNEARQRAAAAAEAQEEQLEDQLSQATLDEDADDETNDADGQEDRWWEAEAAEEPALSEDASPWAPPGAVDPPEKEAASLTQQAADTDPPPPKVHDEDSEELPVLNGRERLAGKAFRATILGFYSQLLHFYASYLIIRVLIDPRPLEAKLKRKFRWAVLLNGFFWFTCFLFFFLIYNQQFMYRGIRSDF